jgi:galactokinase
VDALKKHKPEIKALRDATADDLKLIEKEVDEIVFKRARHVISENLRTEQFAAKLRTGDYENAGKLMVASHISLRDDYEVSCVELDFLVDELLKQDGVVGARMTGGGFGGSTVALVRKDKVEAVQAAIKPPYKAKFTLEATTLVTKAADGARFEKV